MSSVRWLIVAAGAVTIAGADVSAQRYTCPPPNWSLTRVEALKLDAFKMPDTVARNELALALPACLGHPNPAIRDGIAVEALSAWMRGGQLDRPTLQALRGELLKMITRHDAEGFSAPFAALVLAEVARTDRLAAWMSMEERNEMVRAAARYLSGRGVTGGAGREHGLLGRRARSAGAPDRLHRAAHTACRRGLARVFRGDQQSAAAGLMAAAFTSELGIKKRHNVRAFLLSVYASAAVAMMRAFGS